MGGAPQCVKVLQVISLEICRNNHLNFLISKFMIIHDYSELKINAHYFDTVTAKHLQKS